MARRCKGGGFRSLRDLGPGATGLPRRRIRDLALAASWRRVAGEALSRRAVLLRVARGTLEIEVPDRRWADALSTAIGRLAGRLAAEAPALGIRRAKLKIAGESSFSEAIEIEVGAPAREADPDGPESGTDPGAAQAGGPSEPIDIAGVASRYLDAASRRAVARRPPGRFRRDP